MQIILLLRLHEVTATSLLIQLKIQCGKLKYDVPPNCWNWCEHLLCQHNKLFCSSVFPFQLLFVSLPSGTRDQLSLHRTLWAPHPSVSLSMASSLLYKINKWKSKFMLVFFSFHSPFFFFEALAVHSGRGECRGSCRLLIMHLNFKSQVGRRETSALPSSSTSSSVSTGLSSLLNSKWVYNGMQIVLHNLCVCLCVCVRLAATSCMAVMPTSLMSSLLLYKHRKVRVSAPVSMQTSFLLLLWVLKSAATPLRIHQHSKRLINRIVFFFVQV